MKFTKRKIVKELNKIVLYEEQVLRKVRTQIKREKRKAKFKWALVGISILYIGFGLIAYSNWDLNIEEEVKPIENIEKMDASEVLEVKTIEYKEEEKKELRSIKKIDKKELEIYLTSYNAEVGQTDSTPCIAGGTGVNICEAEKDGRRIIALSQELTAWSEIGRYRKRLDCGDACITFDPREKVIFKQTQESIDKQGYNPRCNGTFEVSDAMNVRYRKRGDLFFSDRSMNTSCRVIISKI